MHAATCHGASTPTGALTHGLADLCARYGVPLDAHHDALADAAATAAVLPHLLDAHGVTDEAELDALYLGRPRAVRVVDPDHAGGVA